MFRSLVRFGILYRRYMPQLAPMPCWYLEISRSGAGNYAAPWVVRSLNRVIVGLHVSTNHRFHPAGRLYDDSNPLTES